MEAPELPWLHSGLYRFLFGRTLSKAVADAPELLQQATVQQSNHAAAARLDSIVKLVTGVAAELSGASTIWQWCCQLLLLHTVRELQSTRKLLEASLSGLSEPSPPLRSIGALPSVPSGPQFELQEISWSDLKRSYELGRGSFGAVFSALWKGVPVAVKCIELDLGCSKQQMLEEMEREAKMMAFKKHPNIVGIFAVCRDQPAIIMELCTAGSLHKQIERHRSRNHAAEPGSNLSDQQQQLLITPKQVVEILHDAAAAMDHLHTVDAHSTRSAVLHCDLRSPNLLLAGNAQRSEEWKVRIADFGLAQWVGPDPCTLWVTPDKITNHLWVAPEVLDSLCENKCEVSRAADVYAFGAVMRELLTGKQPHVDSSMGSGQVLLLRCGKPCELRGCLKWPRSEELLPGLDCHVIQELRPLFDCCVSTDAQDRPNFHEIEQQLAGLLHDARAATAGSALAELNAENVDVEGGVGMLYASLGPNSYGSATPPAPAAAAATTLKSDVTQLTTPFVATDQQWFLRGSMQSSALAASSNLLTATAAT